MSNFWACGSRYLNNIALLTSVAGIVTALGGCAFSAKLHYRPIAESSIAGAHQGYLEHQIDEKTYLVMYQGHLGVPAEAWAGVYDLKWIKIAQQYTLYRAAEVAQSKGANYFLVLHEDDWNLIRRDPPAGKSGASPRFEPGAAIVMRMWEELPFSIDRGDDRVLDVHKILQNPIEKNSGLAEYLGKANQEKLGQNGRDGFDRWRASVNRFDSVSIPISWHTDIFGSQYVKYEPGIKLVPLAVPGQFELAIWDDKLVHPLQFLTECVKIADQEGFEAFKLENWTGAEYCTIGQYDSASRPECGKVWFRIKATMILQHQKGPDNLERAFIVDEIRSNVMKNK